MTRDDGPGPGDRPSEAGDEPIGAPVLPPWVGETRERAAAGVEGLLRTPGARGAAVAFLVVAGARMVMAMPVAWAMLRPEVAGVTIDVRWLSAVAMPLLLALTLHLATAPRLLPGTPGMRPRLVTGVISALYLTALGTLVAGSSGPWVALGIPLLVQVALIVAFVPPRGGHPPAGATPAGGPGVPGAAAGTPAYGASPAGASPVDALPRRAPSPVRRGQTILAVVYAAVGVLVTVVLVRGLSDIGAGGPWLILEGVEYALVATMAVLAWGVNRAAGAGGALFVVFDALSMLQIVLFAQPFAVGWSTYPALVTWCYVLALGWIAAGALRRALTTA